MKILDRGQLSGPGVEGPNDIIMHMLLSELIHP